MNSRAMTAYLAPVGLEHCVKRELSHVIGQYGRLFLTEGPLQRSFWSQNIWLNPQLYPIRSISHASEILRGMQRNWALYSYAHHRRSQLIQEKLPFLSNKPLTFLGALPTAALGSWTLLEDSLILASPTCSSQLPHGEFTFIEDRENPPSRAYLKLWELFTRLGRYPGRKDVCLDLGASPGGWTWVLAQQLGSRVIAYDRSPLAPHVQSLANVQFCKGDGFKLRPDQHPELTWIFSDLICYPDKLYDYVQKFLKTYPDKNYVFTIKFQGDLHYEVLDAFAKIDGSQILHLSHNKHELTWYRLVNVN